MRACFGFQFFGLLADQVGRRRTMLAAFAAARYRLPLYIVVRTPCSLFWWGAVVGFCTVRRGRHSGGAYYAELFPCAPAGLCTGGFAGTWGALAPWPPTIGVIGKTHGLQAGLAITSGIWLMGAAMLLCCRTLPAARAKGGAMTVCTCLPADRLGKSCSSRATSMLGKTTLCRQWLRAALRAQRAGRRIVVLDLAPDIPPALAQARGLAGAGGYLLPPPDSDVLDLRAFARRA